ncbi:MAG: hypothetical protein V1716_03385 [Candidatus Uhrbacteria bacterium]
MIFFLISFIADAFLLVNFYNSVKNDSGFLPEVLRPYLGLLLLGLIFATFFLAFLSIFTRADASPAKFWANKDWKKVLLIIVGFGLSFFNLIYTLVLTVTGIDDAIAPAWTSTAFTIIILTSIAASFVIWGFACGHEEIGDDESRFDVKKNEERFIIYRQKMKIKIGQHPFVASLIFALASIIFPVITITYYLYFFSQITTVQKTKITERKKMETAIGKFSPLLFSFFLSVLFELELIIAKGADPVFAEPSHVAYTVGLTMVCFYLPIRGFLSLADKKSTSANRWFFFIEALTIFAVQIGILYLLN